MIDYTPYHQYSEIKDYYPPKKDVVKDKVRSYCLLLLYIVIAIALFMAIRWWHYSIWAIIVCSIVLVFLALLFLFVNWISSSMKQRLRADYANVIKSVIGYDFGNDFKLLYTGSHDYEEYLYIFPEESFAPFREYLESMKDGEIKGTTRIISHDYNGKKGAGFTLTDNQMDGVCGTIEKLSVNYEDCFLKHTWTAF